MSSLEFTITKFLTVKYKINEFIRLIRSRSRYQRFRPAKFFFSLSIFIFLAALLQYSFLGYISIFKTAPNILLVLNIILALNLAVEVALLTGFILGLVKDSFGQGIFGLNTILFVAWVVIINVITSNLFKENIEKVLLLASVAGATILEAIVFRSAILHSGGNLSIGIFFLKIILGLSYNISITLLVLKVFKKCVLKYYR